MKMGLGFITLFLKTISLTAQHDPAPAPELEIQMQSPVARLSSVPFQNITDFGVGSCNRMAMPCRNTNNLNNE